MKKFRLITKAIATLFGLIILGWLLALSFLANLGGEDPDEEEEWKE